MKLKPPKPDMTSWKIPIEDVFPIEDGDFRARHSLVFRGPECYAVNLEHFPDDKISADFRSGTAKMADFGLSGIAKNKALVFFLQPRLLEVFFLGLGVC